MTNPNVQEIEQFSIPDLSQYEVIKYIGRGAWTPVFLLKRKTDGSLWAGKFLRPTELAQKQKEDRKWTDDEYWTKEAQEGHIPLHQNIATGFVDRADNGERFYVEKYLGEKTQEGYKERFLNQYLDQTPKIGLEELIHIARGMASALTIQHTKAGGKGRAHGDFNPKNIAYTLDGVIVLSDFGTTTIGDRRTGHVGSELTRAPEEWSDSAVPTKSADVFSFGSTLYRMFTGKYLFQDELEGKFKDNPQSFIDYLRENKDRWNSTIDDKLGGVDAPKYFRELMRKCLYDPKSRLQDGAELSKELEKTIKKYERSRPKARLVRYGIAASLAALVGGASILGIMTNGRASDKIREQEEDLEYGRKVATIQLMEGRGAFSDMGKALDYHQILAWEYFLKSKGITDKRMAYCFFLNPEVAYEAMLATGKNTYKEIDSYVYKADFKLWNAMADASSGPIDSWARNGNGLEMDRKVAEKFEKIKREYEASHPTNVILPNPSLSR